MCADNQDAHEDDRDAAAADDDDDYDDVSDDNNHDDGEEEVDCYVADFGLDGSGSRRRLRRRRSPRRVSRRFEQAMPSVTMTRSWTAGDTACCHREVRDGVGG